MPIAYNVHLLCCSMNFQIEFSFYMWQTPAVFIYLFASRKPILIMRLASSNSDSANQSSLIMLRYLVFTSWTLKLYPLFALILKECAKCYSSMLLILTFTFSVWENLSDVDFVSTVWGLRNKAPEVEIMLVASSRCSIGMWNLARSYFRASQMYQVTWRCWIPVAKTDNFPLFSLRNCLYIFACNHF